MARFLFLYTGLWGCGLVLACSSGEPPASAEQAELAGPPVVVEAIAVPFDPTQPEATGSPGLRYRAGFWLRSEAPRFGGFSGLLIENGHLIAVSDQGWWWLSTLRRSTDGTLLGLDNHRQLPVFDLGGELASRSEERHDAEELMPLADGLAVSFERQHRILTYRGVEARSAAILDQQPRPIEVPAELMQASDNSGLEAMAPLSADRTLILLEAAIESGEDVPGWIQQADGAWQRFSLVQTEDFAPTAADVLRGGDVILVERSYTPEPGPRVRISWLPDSEIRAGAQLRPRELLRLETPRIVDNFEALSIEQEPGGGCFLYLLSDDNFSTEQRTLLLQFELDLESLPRDASENDDL